MSQPTITPVLTAVDQPLYVEEGERFQLEYGLSNHYGDFATAEEAAAAASPTEWLDSLAQDKTRSRPLISVVSLKGGWLRGHVSFNFTLNPEPTIKGSAVEFPEDITLTARMWNFSNTLRYEHKETRTASCGLEITRTWLEEHDLHTGSIHRMISDRTETFVAYFKRTATLHGTHVVATQGTKAWLWRTSYLASDWQSPKAGSVSINGFTRDGNQAVTWHSDEEAGHDVKAHDSTGKLIGPDVNAHGEPSPHVEAATERYQQMMSR